MSSIDGVSCAAAEMRRTFDQRFAAPIEFALPEGDVVILLRVAGETFAVCMAQISGLSKVRQIVPIPTRARGMIGLAAVRGAILPVYDLACLLGLETAGSPGLLMLLKDDRSFALAFDGYEGRSNAFLYETERQAQRRHVRRFARVGPNVRPVIDLAQVQAAIGLGPSRDAVPEGGRE